MSPRSQVRRTSERAQVLLSKQMECPPLTLRRVLAARFRRVGGRGGDAICTPVRPCGGCASDSRGTCCAGCQLGVGRVKRYVRLPDCPVSLVSRSLVMPRLSR
eukprot:963618-Prymnesium_polylepis.1